MRPALKCCAPKQTHLRMQNAFVERAAADELHRMMNNQAPVQDLRSSSLPLLQISQIEIPDLDAESVAALSGQRSPTLRGAVRGGLINIVEQSGAAQVSTELSWSRFAFELGASLGGTEDERAPLKRICHWSSALPRCRLVTRLSLPTGATKTFAPS